MAKLKDNLQSLLGTAYEVSYNQQLNFPITIMTPFIDTMGDNIVIYVETNNHGLYRYTDGGYILDDMLIGTSKTEITNLNKVIDFYNVNTIVKGHNLNEIVSNWYDEPEILKAMSFYAYLQSILDGIATVTKF